MPRTVLIQPPPHRKTSSPRQAFPSLAVFEIASIRSGIPSPVLAEIRTVLSAFRSFSTSAPSRKIDLIKCRDDLFVTDLQPVKCLIHSKHLCIHIRIGAVHHMKDDVCIFCLLQRTAECLDQMMRQLTDKADRIGKRNSSPSSVVSFLVVGSSVANSLSATIPLLRSDNLKA